MLEDGERALNKKEPDLTLMKLTTKCRRQNLLKNNILFNQIIQL